MQRGQGKPIANQAAASVSDTSEMLSQINS
jgi:hypothetical protein